jgi:LmbE family N-acetylglucosaminyl deacetylase
LQFSRILDDEVLACGGTLARHAAEGDEVRVVTFTDGVSSRFTPAQLDEQIHDEGSEWCRAAGTRQVEHESAKRVLGVDSEDWSYSFPDQDIDLCGMSQVAGCVRGAIRGWCPEVVYTHWHGDLNQDHRRVAEAVMVATRPFASSVRRVLACEVPESTAHGTVPFEPNVFVDISGQLLKKVEALRCYKSEKREPPHPRSEANVAAHAGVRGAQAGVEFAEAFMLLREVR